LDPEAFSPYSQVPATCPYPEPTQSSSHNPLPLPEVVFIHYVSKNGGKEIGTLAYYEYSFKIFRLIVV
jgi:hypothetical protein